MTYEEIHPGAEASLERRFRETDIEMFALLSGDNNPLHSNAEYAAKSRFGQRIIPGLLLGSLFSTIFATTLPGPGTVYLMQNLRFIAPVFLEETVVARVTVVEKMEKKRIRFECAITKENGEISVIGESICLPPAS